MPILNAVTKTSRQVWKKGDRTIWEVILDVGGKDFKAKTYSGIVAGESFSGEVETYEKEGRNGSETFVRQAPKETGSATPGNAGVTVQGSKYEMYLSYAKDILVSMLETKGYDKDEYLVLLKAAMVGGNSLYNSRPDAPRPTQPVGEASQGLQEVFGDDIQVESVEDNEPDPFEGIETVPLDL